MHLKMVFVCYFHVTHVTSHKRLQFKLLGVPHQATITDSGCINSIYMCEKLKERKPIIEKFDKGKLSGEIASSCFCTSWLQDQIS
jgi:hypothetical protein